MAIGKLTILAALSAALCFVSTVSGQLVADRIVGGTATTISTVPYLVFISRGGSFICGGSLISQLYALTAAHCIGGYSASFFTVTGGTSYLNVAGVTRSVVRICVTSTYNDQTMTADAALMKLASPMTGTNITPIPLCAHTLYVGDMVRISGWGVETENSSTVPNQVRTAEVGIINKSVCQQNYQGVISLTDTMMCAAAPGKDSCQGDSGGPMVHKGEVCGIVSFGVGCANSNYPGIYTSVTRMKYFINTCMAMG